MSPGQHALAQLVKKHALKFGDFTLKSGQKSNFYLDCRVLTISTHLKLIVEGIKAAAEDLSYQPVGGYMCYDAVGGPAIGADPIVGAFLHSHHHLNDPLRGFIVRKEEKDHGLAGLIIGSVQPGDRCLVIEDVTTTAGSLLKAIRAVEAFGCTVVKAVTLIDRSRGEAAKTLDKYNFSSVLTLADLGIE
jgi:orotate phosphoribosyltransferase